MWRIVFICSFLAIVVINSNKAQEENVIILKDTIFKYTDRDFDLLNAANEGDTSKALALLSIGADVNYSTYDGVTPLMYAAQGGHLRMVEILIDSGANVNSIPYNGINALLGACIAGHILIADTLIQNGANINTQNAEGLTPLMYASAFNNLILTDMLLYYGAKVNNTDHEGNTAIHFSSFYNNQDITDLLISYGADINSMDLNGFTPLMITAQNGHFEHLVYLSERGAKDTVNNNNLNALALAIISKQYEEVKYLIENGADINYHISKTRNPLSTAREYANKHIVKLLEFHNAEMNTKPLMDKFIISIDINGTTNDFMVGFSLGLLESKYGIHSHAGFKTRPWVRSVRYESGQNVYYQFWESRSSVHIGIDKLFRMRKSIDKISGVFIGLNGVYTYGNFRGSSKKPDDVTLAVPRLGFFWTNSYLNLRLNYEYMKLPGSETSPHRINFSIGFMINISGDKVRLKKEPKM